jgi:hypothetical protein
VRLSRLLAQPLAPARDRAMRDAKGVDGRDKHGHADGK